MPLRRTSEEDSVASAIESQVEDLTNNLVPIVKDLVRPLLEIFDFIQIGDQIYADIVNEFVQRVTT